MEKVGTSLLDVQSMEMQNLEEENDANMQQKFNNSTCSVCNKDATDKYLFIYLFICTLFIVDNH